MARATGSHSRTADAQFHGNRAAAGDPAPETDEISGTRADYAPTGADPKPTTVGTIKRTLKEFSEDNLTDWAAALTYYGVLALFPALIALLSIVGLLTDPQQLTDALTAVVPADAADTLNPVIEQIAGNTGTAGFGLIIGLAVAVWSASGYVGAFTRAANVVYETPEGRKIWKLKPLQLLITLIGILFAAVILAMLVLSGPVVDADRLGHRHRRDRPDHLERRQVAGHPRRPGADDRRPLLLDAEREAARLQVGQPRCRRRHPGGDRRLGRCSPSTWATSAATTRPTARWPAWWSS